MVSSLKWCASKSFLATWKFSIEKQLYRPESQTLAHPIESICKLCLLGRFAIWKLASKANKTLFEGKTNRWRNLPALRGRLKTTVMKRQGRSRRLRLIRFPLKLWLIHLWPENSTKLRNSSLSPPSIDASRSFRQPLNGELLIAGCAGSIFGDVDGILMLMRSDLNDKSNIDAAD